jgi:hypothetical protein
MGMAAILSQDAKTFKMRAKRQNKCWVFNQGQKKFVSNPKIGREEEKGKRARNRQKGGNIKSQI